MRIARRTGIRVLLAALLCLGAAHGSAGPRQDRPNILFLFTDDQRADTIAALGNRHIQTPNLDRLARQGFHFRNAYCLGANMGAVCTPSRNMLLSGRAYFRWTGPLAPAQGLNFAESFRRAGYETYHHGKRGNSALRLQERFEHNLYLANDDQERRSGEPGKEIVDRALRFLAERTGDRPFCMYLAFGNPHDPRVAAQRYLDRYRRDRIPLPPNFLPEHPFDNGELRVRDEQLAPWPRMADEIRRHLHEYYAVITALDEQIGRLLDDLDRRGLTGNTWVVFSSDHGLSVGSHGLMGKQNLYEHGMKVPLIFAGPGIRRGSSPALAYLHDIYPTLAELAGAPVPADLDGRSLKPVMDGRAEKVRDSLFLAYRDVQRAVRDDRWKLIRYPKAGVIQLFDLRDDPHERKDRSREPGQQQRVRSLSEELRRWQRELGDTVPVE